MKLWKRLAAGLLAMVTAVGATISAGASKEGYNFHWYKNEKLEDGSYRYVDDGSLSYYGDVETDVETIKTLIDLGTIENYGDPEKETSVLIPASQLENYPVGTIVLFRPTVPGSSYPGIYIADGKRSNYQRSGTVSESNDHRKAFVITTEMKKNGILFTGYELELAGEVNFSSKSTVTIQSVEFTDTVAVKYEHGGYISSGLWTTSSNEFWEKYRDVDTSSQKWFDELNEHEKVFVMYGSSDNPDNHVTVITPDELNDIPVGASLYFQIETTKVVEIGETYTFKSQIQYPWYNEKTGELSRGVDGSLVTMIYTPGSYLISGASVFLSEEMKTYGFTVIVSSDDYTSYAFYSVPSESSEFDPADPTDPVVKPGFSTPAGETSVKEVPLDTVVTQKTAVSDGKYNERFVKKVAASDVVGKTKATFTLSNGTVTKTVSTTKYNTSLTVDGETLSAGSEYVFLTYTLSGIPEDVTITVGDVVLE